MFTMHPWLWLLIVAVIIWKINLSTAETRVVCYYTNWSVYRPGTAKFNPQNINPYLCTHLIYAFGGFTKENNFKPFDKYQDIEKGGYAKFTGLKTYNKNLKTMLAVGGWNEGSSRFSPMVANSERRKEFVKNSIKFLRQNHFDGLDLDWEYPSFRDGGKPRDRDNYATLVQELREEYDRESEKTGRPRLLLTMAVPAGIEYINKGYDVPRLMKYLDWMNILSYDYHSAFEPAVNHHSPLFPLEEESEYNYDSDLNINHTINHYLEAGAEKSKLVLGIPTYGRSYTLFNPDASEIGDPADGPGEMGDATRENGYLAYYEICEKVKSEDWIVEQPNPSAMGPYAYKDDQWVGYDDESIVKKKAEFVAHRRLGGIMFWSIDNDDFRGNCHGKPYPLIEAAKEALMAASGHTIDNAIAPEKPTKSKSRNRSRQNNRKTSNDEEEDSKPAQNSGGRQNADIPASRKRVRTKSQNKDEESQVSNKRRLRVHQKEEEEEEEEEEQEDSDEEAEQVSKKRRLRVHKQNSSRRKEPKRRGTTTTTTSTNRPSALTPAWHTPEPPTTPDPGGDFKCVDEGFFPHPRDCKKYFWCLSGAAEGGIIAHQFTCPSGLYFNKAADSCDYTQNVLCNKKKAKATSTTATSTTTTTTTTAATVSTTTTRRPPKITAVTFRTTFTSTPSTTTSDYEEEYEYEDEDEDEDLEDEGDSEEDPRVIKELIDLIKKAGGIEELEKQLKLHEDGTVSVTASGSTTPPTFSKTLYERVLSRAGGRNTEKPLLKPKNSRGPQYDGTKDGDANKRTRPQYTAIARQRSSTEKSLNKEEESDDNKEEEKSISRKIAQPQYKTISRSRSSTTSTSTEADFETTRLRGESIDDENDGTTKLGPEYVTIRRQRPTTQEPTPKYVEIRGRTSPVNSDEAKIIETATLSTITNVNKTSELSNNEYINTVEQQNITDTVEVPKTLEGRILPNESNFATEKDETAQLSTILLQNGTENSLSKDEQRYRSSTISIEPSTTASTKVSDPISSRNLLRPRPFQKITESTDNSNSSTNVTENTTKRGSNRLIQDIRFKHSRKRISLTTPEDADNHKDLIDEDVSDTDQENISNETDSPNVSDRINLRNKLKIESGSNKQTAPFRPRPFSTKPKTNTFTPTEQTGGEEKPAGANYNVDQVFTRTESTNQQKKPTRRGSAKFAPHQFESGQPEDGYHYYDDSSYDSRSLQERKYRPDIAQEIADLSSLTSADISNKRLNDGSRKRVVSRQRTDSTEKASNVSTTAFPVKNEEPQEGNLKTSPRTRKLAPSVDLSRNSKRVVRPLSTTTTISTTAVDEASSTTQSSRIQKKSPVFIRPPTFRRPLNDKAVLNESVSEKPILPKPSTLQRNGYKLENSTGKRLDFNHSNASEETISENPVNKSNRKVIRRFKPTPSTASTTISTTTTITSTTTTTPTPTTTTTPTPTTTTESQENNIVPDDFTTISTTTTTELNNDQQNITEIIDFTQNTTYKNSVSLLPVAVTDNDIYYNITEKGSSDNDDDVYRTSEEEEENIKLSETSIREKSEIHINALNDNSDKHRRRVVKRIRNEGKTSQTKFNYAEEDEKLSKDEKTYNVNFESVTEHSPRIRTRKIIEDKNSKEEETVKVNFDLVTEHNPVLRTRKIIDAKDSKEEEEEKTDKINFDSVTEHSPALRTRKIVRKLPQTTFSTAEPTTTQSSVSEAHKGRTRKIIRRLRPTTTESPSTAAQSTLEETLVTKNVKSKSIGAKRIRPAYSKTNEAVSEVPLQKESEEIEQNGNEYPRFNFRRRQNVKVQNQTISTNSSEVQEQKPLIRRVVPQRQQKVKINTSKENSDEEVTEEKSHVNLQRRQKFKLSENENRTESEEQKPLIRRIIPQRRHKVNLYGTKKNSTETTNTQDEETVNTRENTETVVGKRKSLLYGSHKRRIFKLNTTESVSADNSETNDDNGENTNTKLDEETPSVSIKRRQKFGAQNTTEAVGNEETNSEEFKESDEDEVLIRRQKFRAKNTNETQTNKETPSVIDRIKLNITETANTTTVSQIDEKTTKINQNTATDVTTETQILAENSTTFDNKSQNKTQNSTEIDNKSLWTTENGQTEEEETTTLNINDEITDFSSTASSADFSSEQTEKGENDDKDDSAEKVVETSTKFYRTKLNKIQKLTITTTQATTEKQSSLSVYSRFNTRRKDILKPQPEVVIENQQTNNDNHEITSETNEKLESITELNSTTEFGGESLQSSTEIDEVETTTTALNDEGDTTIDSDEFTELPTTEIDFTTTDLSNITAETEKTTIKTTTPFYYRQKLSRPPFLHQRTRPVTEASRPVISTSARQFTRGNGLSRYSTRKDRFKSRFEKKSTTESVLKAEGVESNNNASRKVTENLTLNVIETPQNLTTENYNNINNTSGSTKLTASTQITASTISTISTISTSSTATPEYETTKQISENEIATESTENDFLITTEFGTTTEIYDEKQIAPIEFLGINSTTANESLPENNQLSNVSDSLQTTTLNSTNLSSTSSPVTTSTLIPTEGESSTEQLSIEDIQQITDSILEKELLAIIEKYEEERETLDQLQKEGYLNLTRGNDTKFIEEALIESLFNFNSTEEKTTSEEAKNITDILQHTNFNTSTNKENHNFSTEIEHTNDLLLNKSSELEKSNQTELQNNSTGLRRGFNPLRRTFTTTKTPTKENQEDVLSIVDKLNSDTEEESSQRPSFKPSSPRSKYKPRVKPTERSLLYKQTTRRTTVGSNIERSTPSKRLFLRPTTERTILDQHLNYQGVTEKAEEEYDEDEDEEDEYTDDEEDEEGESDQEESLEEEKPEVINEKVQEEKVVENTETERTLSNSFYRQNKPQYVPQRTGFRVTTEKPRTLAPRRFGKVKNSPVTNLANNPSLQRNAETKNSRNRLFNKSRKANTPHLVNAGLSSTTTTTTAATTITTAAATTITTTAPTTITTTAATTTIIEETATPTQDFSNPITLTTAVYEQEDSIPTTTITTSTGETSSTTETSDQPFTLQHIFSEPENASTTETYADVTDTSADKKLERLIEVNRIVQVSFKEGKFKHNSMVENQVDRIGAINRITVIKVVDPINGTNTSEIVFNVTDGSGNVKLAAVNITLPVELNGTIIGQEHLINASINAIYSDINNYNDNVNISIINNDNVNNVVVNNTEYNLNNGTKLAENNLISLSNEVLKEQEYNTSNIVQLYGAGELTDYGHKLEAYMPPHTKEEEDYAKAHIRIDGKSVVNTFTPKPSAFNTESSTISLEGLFQPHLRQEDPNDEILQTQNANYVNIKILEQDGSPRRLKFNERQPLVPIRLLKQDEYTTSRAQVVEITPEMKSGVIKIAPIAISLANMEHVAQHRQSENTEHTTVVFPISTNKGDD